jgi:hypothetical protein
MRKQANCSSQDTDAVRARLMVSSAGNAQVMSCLSAQAGIVPGLPSSTAALIGFPFP